MSADGCYETSCWCGPCRWLSSCFTSKPPEAPPISQVAIATMGQIQAIGVHHRERTWVLSNGRMAYEVSHSVVKENIEIS